MKKEYLVANSGFTTCEKCDTKEEAYETAKDLASADKYEDYYVYEIKLIATAYIPEPQAIIEEMED